MLTQKVKIFTDGNIKSLTKKVNSYLAKEKQEGYYLEKAYSDMYKTGDCTRHITYTVILSQNVNHKDTKVLFFDGGFIDSIENTLNWQLEYANKQGYVCKMITHSMYKSGEFAKYFLYSMILEK